jgi:hypothetical protein
VVSYHVNRKRRRKRRGEGEGREKEGEEGGSHGCSLGLAEVDLDFVGAEVYTIL